jgi:hypothetical protein
VLGAGEGASDGIDVGVALVEDVGASVGGTVLGAGEGESDGIDVGVALERDVGTNVGGTVVCAVEGASDRMKEGMFDGMSDLVSENGLGDGIIVGG